MPVSSIAVTQGSGAYLHTWQRTISAVNREEQYVQLAEPAIPTFTVVPATDPSTATTSSHLLQIMSGSSTYTRIHKITISQATAAGSTTRTEIALVRLTSAGTGGTSVTPYGYDGSDTANATAMTLPSSKGTESATLWLKSIVLTTAPGTGSWEWVENQRCKPIVIPSGTSNGLALRMGTGVASATVWISVEFTETAYL